MSQKPNHKTSFAARLMLLLALVQFMFVAFEAAGAIDVLESRSDHHEEYVLDGHNHLNLSDSTHHADLCDHCCHCHGHGTHLSMLPTHNIALGNITTIRPLVYPANFQSACLDTIHRPPIA